MLLAPGTTARRRLATATERYGDVIEQGRIRATELVNTGRDMLDEKLAVGQDLVNTAVEKARAGLERLESEADRQEASEREASSQQF
jgi:hypothetical protein